MINKKDILEIVNDFESWRGNSYTLAVAIFEATKQAVIDEAIADGLTDFADKIRDI